MDVGLYFLILAWSSVVWSQKIPPTAISESIEYNAGLYFERLNELRFIHDEWTYVIYLDLYENQFNVTAISEIIKFIGDNCIPRKLCSDQEKEIDRLSQRTRRVRQLKDDLTKYLRIMTEDMTNISKIAYNNEILELKSTDSYFTYMQDNKTHVIRSSLDGFEEKRYKGNDDLFDTFDRKIKKLINNKDARNFTRLANDALRIIEIHLNIYIQNYLAAL